MHTASPVRVDTAAAHAWPLHDTAASRRIEQAALAAHPPFTLMQRAGTAVARLALALAPHARRVQVWAGPGNNGGDGVVAATCLAGLGRAVQVNLIGDAARLPDDAARALSAAHQAGVPISQADEPTRDDADLIIDGLLGLGARRAPEGALAAAIDHINARPVPVLAIDIPSGLHPDTGALLGANAVRAAHTLSLLTLKPGCFTGQGRDHAGTVWLDQLGWDVPGDLSAQLYAPPPRATRSHASHKGSFGDVAVIGGAPGMTGAAWLAARAALAAGAGRVYACLLDERAPHFDGSRPELMVRERWWLEAPALLSRTTVACGCGGGDAVRAALPPLLAHVPRLVLDADALNAIAGDAALQAPLQRRADRGLATLLTPHPLEAARLLGCDAAQVQRDRLHAAQSLADRFGCAVLLKGSGTVIAQRGQRPFVNPTGTAALATAGTGDVLAGWAAGLWAQQPEHNAQDVGALAAWQHGRAADPWPHGGPLRAADLVEALVQLR